MQPNTQADRRSFLKLMCAGTLATAGAAGAATPAAAPEAKAAAAMPKGKIGNLNLSRLILGTNHITFYT